MSNGTKQGSGLSAQCVGCLIIGLVVGLFAGAFLPTLFSGNSSPPPARHTTPADQERSEGYENYEEGVEADVDEAAEELDDVIDETIGEPQAGEHDAEGGEEGAGG
jgi:hypothetical protein